MPLYIRNRQLDIPTPTISSVASDEEEENYLTDPEQIFDELPMPFRLIDKIIYEIVEDSWERITQRKIEREIDAKRIKPPCHKPTGIYPEYENVTCINLDIKQKIFIAHNNTLTVKSLEGDQADITWQPPEEICIEKITCANISPDIIVLALTDDMGFGKLVVFAESMFLVVKTMNEHVDGTSKSNMVKFELSEGGEFCACALECEGEAWVDFYKIPKDNWVKEIETAKKEFIKKSETAMEEAQTQQEEEDNKETDVTPNTSVESLFPEVKFSSLVPVLKVKCSPQVSATNAKNAQEVLDQVSNGDVIGCGYLHCLTKNCLEAETTLFNYFHEQDLVFAEEAKHSTVKKPMFHFLKGSKMEPGTLYAKGEAPKTQSVMLWWSDTNLINTYSLTKTGKDIEFKPEVVYPHSANITNSALSSCGNYIAIGLKNGALTVWDREFGSSIFVSNISKVAIKNILFMPKNFKSYSKITKNSAIKFEQKDPVYMLVGCQDGEILFISCSSFNNDSVKTVVNKPLQFGDKFQYFNILPGAPELILFIQNNGGISIIDSKDENIKCNIMLGDDMQCEIANDNYICFEKNDDLYIIGSSTIETGRNLLMSFTIKDIPALTACYKRHASDEKSAEKSVDFMDYAQELLTVRIAGQSARTAKLASRWHNMTKQLEFLMDLKENVAMHRRSHKVSTASTPASKWSKTTSKILANKHKAKKG